MNKKGLGIIFHSGSYDRLYHGLSIALSALALERQVRFFFTYWALEYLKKERSLTLKPDKETQSHRRVIEKNIKRGHMIGIKELFDQAKKMGAKFYACTNSMGLLNITRDELIDIVDKSMGITAFLTETSESQILFI